MIIMHRVCAFPGVYTGGGIKYTLAYADVSIWIGYGYADALHMDMLTIFLLLSFSPKIRKLAESEDRSGHVFHLIRLRI